LQQPSSCWGLPRIIAQEVALADEDTARCRELSDRYDALAEEHQHTDEMPEAAEHELAAIEQELDALTAKTRVYLPEDMSRAGAVITVNPDGTLRIERGFVRPEDQRTEAGTAEERGAEGEISAHVDAETSRTPATRPTAGTSLPASLERALEAQRTAALQATIIQQPELALRVLLHSLVAAAFYDRAVDTVVHFHGSPPNLIAACPSIGDSAVRQKTDAIEQEWRHRLPSDPHALWPWLADQDITSLMNLLAVCLVF
jgi:ParB family chromosome partitioning protein